MLDLHRQSGGWDLAALLFISLFHDENYTDVSSVTLEKIEGCRLTQLQDLDWYHIFHNTDLFTRSSNKAWIVTQNSTAQRLIHYQSFHNTWVYQSSTPFWLDWNRDIVLNHGKRLLPGPRWIQSVLRWHFLGLNQPSIYSQATTYWLKSIINRNTERFYLTVASFYIKFNV